MWLCRWPDCVQGQVEAQAASFVVLHGIGHDVRGACIESNITLLQCRCGKPGGFSRMSGFLTPSMHSGNV